VSPVLEHPVCIRSIPEVIMPKEQALTELLVQIVVDDNIRARFGNDRAALLDEFNLTPATRKTLLTPKPDVLAINKLIDNQQTASGVTALETLLSAAVDRLRSRSAASGRTGRKTSQKAGRRK
jgi:hypothetical protein